MKRMKNLLALLCASTILIGNMALSQDEYVAEVDEELLYGTLSDYFCEREELFTDENNSGISTYAMNKEDDRSIAINAWKNELEIELKNVEVQYCVRDILSNTLDEVQILAYEWTWVDYICEDGVEDTLGFGTDHLMTFSKTTSGLELINDIYSEIIGYECGTEEELATLQVEVELADIATQEMYEDTDYGISTCATNSELDTYNAAKAVTYSKKWCGNSTAGTSSGTMTPANYNPQYYYYAGADCCNFVSQCLKAGGLSMDSTWKATLNTSGTVTVDSSYSKSSEAWRYVPTFKSYWERQGYSVTRLSYFSHAIVGNPVFWLKSDGYSTNHVMLIVDVTSNGKVLVNGHNSDVYRYPIDLSAKKYYMLDVAHRYMYESISSTQHVKECSCCGHTKTEAHDFTTINGINFTCKECNYKK